MQENYFQMIVAAQEKQELTRILSCNEKIAGYGLTISEEEARALLIARSETLREQKRVEFGESILPRLMETFCDSPYIEEEEFADCLSRLQEVFYLFKNESMDRITDDELLDFMKEQFDGNCYGSVEYLEETCLPRFSHAVRAGYEPMGRKQGEGQYAQFSEETRWERELYWEAMKELFG